MCRFEIYQLLGREHLAKVSAPHRYQYTMSLYPQHLFHVLPLMVKITDLHFLLIDLNGLAGRTFKSFPN